MEQRIYRLTRAGGIDTNPTLFVQTAGTFASPATEYGHQTRVPRLAGTAPLPVNLRRRTLAPGRQLPRGSRLAPRPGPVLRVRPFLATQRPEQLPPLLRNNLLSYGTLVSFAQIDSATAKEVAGAMGEEWTQEDIQHLEPCDVLVRSHVEPRRQSAFIVKLPNYEADVADYPATQGYADTALKETAL